MTKARHAEYAGADLLVIIDNSNEEANSVVMIDDGTGADIKIPTVMITKQDGETITECLKGKLKSSKVWMELSFGEIKKPDKIQIVFVYTPLQTQMLELLGKAYALYEDCSKLLTLLRKQH